MIALAVSRSQIKRASALVEPNMAMDIPAGLLIPGLFLLLHLVGLILALAYRRRCPAACALLFVASIVSITGSFARISLVLGIARPDPFILGGGLSVLNWIAYGLMLLAIFAGRNEPKRPPPLPPDDDWTPPRAPAAAKESTGIQQRRG